MNMRKVGIVTQSKSGQVISANPRKQRLVDMTRYTLCEYQEQAMQNGSSGMVRGSLGFDTRPHGAAR
jgi:hypothetical protein